MSRALFNALTDLHTADPQPTTYAAVVARNVATSADLVDVSLVNTDDRGALTSEAATWPARGDRLPQRGDQCTVVIDDAGRPAVVAWNFPHWGS